MSMVYSGNSGSYWIEDRYQFFNSTGTVPTFRFDANIRIYKCNNCGSKMLLNIENVVTAVLVCANCGSPELKREE